MWQTWHVWKIWGSLQRNKCNRKCTTAYDWPEWSQFPASDREWTLVDLWVKIQLPFKPPLHVRPSMTATICYFPVNEEIWPSGPISWLHLHASRYSPYFIAWIKLKRWNGSLWQWLLAMCRIITQMIFLCHVYFMIFTLKCIIAKPGIMCCAGAEHWGRRD